MKEEKMIKGFHNHNEAMYAKTCPLEDGIINEISIGYYSEDGSSGTYGEFKLVWSLLDGKPIFKLECYDENIGTLIDFNDVLNNIQKKIDKYKYSHKEETLSIDEVLEILEKHNVKDCTKK